LTRKWAFPRVRSREPSRAGQPLSCPGLCRAASAAFAAPSDIVSDQLPERGITLAGLRIPSGPLRALDNQ
jgi:hypothetical protein